MIMMIIKSMTMLIMMRILINVPEICNFVSLLLTLEFLYISQAYFEIS